MTSLPTDPIMLRKQSIALQGGGAFGPGAELYKQGLIMEPNGFLERDLTRWAGGSPENVARALGLYRAIKDDPIIDPHTHYETAQIVRNRSWDNPTQLFLGVPNAKREDGTGIGFDHYAARVMLAQGVPELLVYGRENANAPLPSLEFEKQRFTALVGAMERAFPNPSARWFKVALEEVFGITTPVKAVNADILWEAISAKLATDEFKPQQMLQAHNVKVALTTDSPHDTLADHVANRDGAHVGPRLLPTFRPDRMLYPEKNNRFPDGDFKVFVNQLSKASGLPITDLSDFLEVVRNRMNYFQERGCVAMDIGLENFSDRNIDQTESSKIFSKAIEGQDITTEEAQVWKAFMVSALCKDAAKRGWTQYFHQGAGRNLNSKLAKAHGADVGGDGPGESLNRQGFIKLLDHLNSAVVEGSIDGTGLPKSIFFAMDSNDFEFIIDNINGFQGNNAGIQAKLQLGPPWWMNDYVGRNADVIQMMGDRGHLQSAIGMLSDARSLPPVIGRIIEYRALLAAKLVNIFPDESDEVLLRIAHNITHKNVAKFIGVESLLDDGAVKT